MVDPTKLANISNWLIAGAQPSKSFDAIIEATALRLNDAGIPIDNFVLNGLFIHPHFRGIQIRWSRKRGLSRQSFTHEFMESNFFYRTPTSDVMSDRRGMRLALSDTEFTQEQTFESDYQRSGYSELILLPLFNVDGTVTGVLEIGTKQPGGLSDEEYKALRRIQAPLARIKEYFTELYDKQITLATYVGEETSKRVLSGKIVLGSGETISAVLLFADVSGFTQLSNEAGSTEVLAVLNRFFSAIDQAVGENHGEILKFLGDGVLAIFPTPDEISAQEIAASGALDAVKKARKALEATKADKGVAFRAALHVGDVFFGNIGSGSRMDFTAIGPAVNLASRMLQETSQQGFNLVCSSDFQQLVPELGENSKTCDFKGFNEPIKIHIID